MNFEINEKTTIGIISRAAVFEIQMWDKDIYDDDDLMDSWTLLCGDIIDDSDSFVLIGSGKNKLWVEKVWTPDSLENKIKRGEVKDDEDLWNEYVEEMKNYTPWIERAYNWVRRLKRFRFLFI